MAGNLDHGRAACHGTRLDFPGRDPHRRLSVRLPVRGSRRPHSRGHWKGLMPAGRMVPMQRDPVTELSVPWIGSIAWWKPFMPGVQPCPSPGTPSSRNAARRFHRSTYAAARPASDTISRGRFRPISSASRHRKCRSAGVPASRAARSASARRDSRFIAVFPPVALGSRLRIR